MKRGAAIAAVITVFLTGAIAGAVGMWLYCTSHRSREADRFGARVMVAELEQRLGLSPEQKVKVDAILEDAHKEILAQRQEMRRQVGALMKRTHQRLWQVLTPQQRAEFERQMTHREELRRHFFPRPHRPPDHSPPPQAPVS